MERNPRSNLMDRKPINLSVRGTVGAGLFAGAVFAVLQMVGAASSGAGVYRTWQLFASVGMGESALGAMDTEVFFVGLLVHTALSISFAFIWSAIARRVSSDIRDVFWSHAAAAMLYGVLLWAVNYHLIARFAYPWFLTRTNDFFQAAIHALAYGLPLALVLVGRNRRVAQPLRAGERVGPAGDEVPV